MSVKLEVTMGGEVDAPVVDYTDAVTFLGDADNQLGMQFDNGGASQGTFVLDDDDGVIPKSDDTRNLAAHNLVTLSEDASGTKLWLAVGIVAPKDSHRNENLVAGDARQYDVTVEDANALLRLLKLTEDWERPAETGYARLVALQAYTLAGASSTATWHSVVTDITVDSDHKAPNTNTVTMPAKTYDAGTGIVEIIQDCADTEGKVWGVTIHHEGGSHLCLQYILENDNTTALSPVKISDVPADHDFTSLTAPCVPPSADATSHEDGQELPAVLIVRYGSGDKFVLVTDGATSRIASYGYAADVYYDDESVTEAQATAKGQAILAYRGTEHVTHELSIRLKDTQVGLLEVGQSIVIRSTALIGGQYLNTEQTRRIALLKWELESPRVDDVEAIWVAHLQLDRALRRSPYRKGNKATTTAPKPPVAGSRPTFVSSGHGNATSTLAMALTIDANDPTGAIYCMLAYSGSTPDAIAVSWRPDNNDPGSDVSFTRIATITTGGELERAQIWRLLSPTATVDTSTVRVTSTNIEVVAAAYVYLSGVDQDNPETDTSTNTGTSTSSTVTVTKGSNDLVLDMVGWAKANSANDVPSATAGQTVVGTENSDQTFGVGDVGAGFGRGTAATTTWNLTSSYTWGAVSVAVAGVAGDTGPTLGSTSTPGTSQTYVPIDSVIEHGDLSGEGGTMHDATQIEFTPIGTIAATDVQAAIAEVATDAAADLAAKKLDDLAAPDDNTDLNATTSAHGLLPKLGGGTTNFLRADGTWNTPAGGASLTIEEEDGAPTGTPTTLKVTNGRLTDNGDGSFSLSIPSPTGGTVTVEDEDGTPSVAADTIKFPNGSVSDNGDGSVSVSVAAGSLGPADDASQDTQVTLSSGNTNVDLDSTTITGAAAGTYYMAAACYVNSVGGSNVVLEASSAGGSYSTIDARDCRNNEGDRFLLGLFVHSGGDLAVRLRGIYEFSNATLGLSGDSRWGRGLVVFRVA